MKDENRVGLSFVYERHFDQVEFTEKYIQIINHILNTGKLITLFCLYTGDSYADVELVNTLREKSCLPQNVKVHIYNGDIFQTISEIHKCSFFISMRLHGIVFSYMLQIPFLSIEYDPKNTYFCQTVNYPKEMVINYRALDNKNIVVEKIDKLFELNHSLYKSVKPIQETSDHVVSMIGAFIEEVRKR